MKITGGNSISTEWQENGMNRISLFNCKVVSLQGREFRTHRKEGIHQTLWWKPEKEGDHEKNLDVDGRIIIKWIAKKLDVRL
jgi:hypothetical protein